MNLIFKNLDQRSTVVSATFIDLKKAFDTVDHQKLFVKLNNCGIRSVALELLKSYLTNRSQFVSFGKIKSSTRSVDCGVPQGSVLGPLLFLIFLNDIQDNPLKGKLFLYADDAVFFYSSNSDSSNCMNMNEDLCMLSRYFSKNSLTLNRSKTKIMHFHSYGKKLNNDVSVLVDGVQLETVDNFKYLGIILDTHLTFKYHCTYLTNKLSRMNGIMYKLHSFLRKTCLRLLYFAFIYSQLNYMVNLYALAPKQYLRPVQVLQNRAIKFTHSLNYFTRSVDLYTVHSRSILPIKGLQVFATLRYVK